MITRQSEVAKNLIPHPDEEVTGKTSTKNQMSQGLRSPYSAIELGGMYTQVEIDEEDLR